MGEKLSPSRTKGYMIIKRIPAAIYNYWKAASDYGIPWPGHLSSDFAMTCAPPASTTRALSELFCYFQPGTSMGGSSVGMRILRPGAGESLSGGGLGQGSGGTAAVAAIVAQQAFLFRAAGEAFCRHLAITKAKRGVGLQPRGQTVVYCVAAQSGIAPQQIIGRIGSHIPLHDGAREVPGDVGATGEEMVVPMGGAVGLEDSAFGQQPLVGLHATIGEHGNFHLQVCRLGLVGNAKLLVQIPGRHGGQVFRMSRRLAKC